MKTDAFFLNHLKQTFEQLTTEQNARFPDEQSVRVDIHCHDCNSDVPDERMARMLRIPKTWAKTEDVLACIKRNGAVPITITNHNNARTCFEMMEKGMDVLPSAEFACTMPNFDFKLHVLTYGFDPTEEEMLGRLRHNLYRFLEYTRDRDLVNVLAHPLFFYGEGALPPFQYLERVSLMFDNIEVWNGRLDAWQNLLTASFVGSLNEERILEISKQERFSSAAFCRRPFVKQMTGGSDCHTALFAGSAGVRFHIPNLVRRKERMPLSRLVLESFKRGEFSWFGTFNSEIKITAAILDYFCQMVMHMEDPGLFRLLLHKGSAKEKLIALSIVNGVMELRRHKYTSRFLSTFHNALHGKRPGFIFRRMTKTEFRPFIDNLDEIAMSSRRSAAAFSETLERSLPLLQSGLIRILANRIGSNLAADKQTADAPKENPMHLIERLEYPAYLRDLLSHKTADEGDISRASGAALLDGLSFPALMSFFLGLAHFAGVKTVYANRSLLNEAAKKIGKHEHPARVLWLTDTLFDRNDVSTSLGLLLEEIRKRDLPIDIATVSNKEIKEDHLVTFPSVITLSSSLYREQPIRFADYTALHRLFLEKRYDRLVCSTEGPMGLAALYLKSAFSVPAYFYMHTDWIDFANRVLLVDKQTKDRLRRLLRAYYKEFDGVFTLNGDHAKFLASDEMGIDALRIHRASLWAKNVFRPRPSAKTRLFPNVRNDTPIVLFSGRISEDKGVMDLPAVFSRIQRLSSSTVMVIAGDGPSLSELKQQLPNAVYTGRVDEELLSKMYTAADLLLLPSRFDTFGNVALEAHACGLPAIAYNTNGPKDIILDGKTGFLVESTDEMADRAAFLLINTKTRLTFRENAEARAADFNVDDIIADLVSVLGFESASAAAPESVDIDRFYNPVAV